MDITLLRSFVAIADLESFSAAADRLNVTQSTISHQIARLEQQTGRELFTRTTRSCRLTADGAWLLDHARLILGLTEEIRHRFAPGQLSGKILVGVPDDHHIFGPVTRALSAFIGDHPMVTLEIQAGLSADLAGDLKSRRVDLAILRDVDPDDWSDAVVRERLVWIGAHGAAITPGAPVPLALVAGPCNYRKAAIDTLQAAGQAWRCVVSCTSLEGVLAVVESGLAVSVVSESDARPAVRRLDESDGLPRLPGAALKIRFAAGRPPMAVRALAAELVRVLAPNDPSSGSGGDRRGAP